MEVKITAKSPGVTVRKAGAPALSNKAIASQELAMALHMLADRVSALESELSEIKKKGGPRANPPGNP